MLISVKNIFADETKNNSYTRDIYSGKFFLSTEKYILPQIRYDVELKGETTFVKGYYFDSEIIKFIDTYLNNKLSKTEYYSKSGTKVFERSYIYNENEKILFIETNAVNEKTKFNYLNKIYFEYSNAEIKVNQITNYSLLKNKKQSTYNCIENLILDENYSPKVGNSKILVSSETESKLINVSEKWNYKKDGFSYVCSINDEVICNYSQLQKKELKIRKSFYENRKTFLEEYLSISDNKISEIKIFKNNRTEYTGICNHFDESYKDYYDDEVQYIYLKDEKILLQNEKVHVDNLCIPLDIFGFRYFGLDFSLYE